MEKILIIQTAFIGDAILTLPMIGKLKEKYLQSEIYVLAIPSTADIFSSSPFIDGVLTIDKKNKHKSVFALLKFIKELKAENFTKIYSPHRSLRTSMIVLGSGVKETFGFSNSSVKHVYKNIVKYQPAHHEVQRNLELIGCSKNENDWKILPEIKSSKENEEKIKDFLNSENLNSNIVAVAPGSIWNTKVYPEKYFDEIINFLNKKSFHTIIIGSEKDKSICDRLYENNKSGSTSAAGLFSVPETIELLKHVKILISNDSAPAHMGVSADIPVLMIYCSTVPDFGFYPYNKKSSYLSYDELTCKPCGIHGHKECPVKTFDCGFKLKPQDVFKKIEEMINV